jgi:hypothetical protein
MFSHTPTVSYLDGFHSALFRVLRFRQLFYRFSLYCGRPSQAGSLEQNPQLELDLTCGVDDGSHGGSSGVDIVAENVTGGVGLMSAIITIAPAQAVTKTCKLVVRL